MVRTYNNENKWCAGIGCLSACFSLRAGLQDCPRPSLPARLPELDGASTCRIRRHDAQYCKQHDNMSHQSRPLK
jgi:hypothetical protein